jgi:hypothetical protein
MGSTSIGLLARTGDDEFAALISGQEADRATRVALALVGANLWTTIS